jgi:hypothetical protein
LVLDENRDDIPQRPLNRRGLFAAAIRAAVGGLEAAAACRKTFDKNH